MDIILKTELKYIGIRSGFISLAIYLLSFIIYKPNISVLLGLILGTFVMFLNMIILYNQVSKTVWKEKGKKTSAKMFGGYIIRMAMICAFIILAMKVEFISWIGMVIPLIYPRLIYTVGAILKKE